MKLLPLFFNQKTEDKNVVGLDSAKSKSKSLLDKANYIYGIICYT